MCTKVMDGVERYLFTASWFSLRSDLVDAEGDKALLIMPIMYYTCSAA